MTKLATTKHKEPRSAIADPLLADLKLSDKTRATYAELLDLIPPAVDDPAVWLRKRLQTAPLGTVLPWRAALKHYLTAMGVDAGTIEEVLPIAVGKAAKTRPALGPKQLRIYEEAVTAWKVSAPRTILLLLPLTGLRITEACTLTFDALRVIEDRRALVFVGKRGKERVVPLNKRACAVLDAWLAVSPCANTSYLFPGYNDGAIQPHAVRKYTRALRTLHPSLPATLSPHVLRHTFCTNAIRVMDISALQAIAGHESITTTSKYLHPSVASLADAMDALIEDDTP